GVVLQAGAAGDALRDRLVELTETTPAGSMLNERVCRGYGDGLARLEASGAKRLASGQPGSGPTEGVAAVWETEVASVAAVPELLAEVFGPSTLLVRYHDDGELLEFSSGLEGQLTATLHGEPAELATQGPLVAVLAERAGRLIVNQFPTGVEVSPAMVHGGPFPATSDGRSTSVGTHAIERFTRLVAYQNFPQELLPRELRDT